MKPAESAPYKFVFVALPALTFSPADVSAQPCCCCQLRNWRHSAAATAAPTAGATRPASTLCGLLISNWTQLVPEYAVIRPTAHKWTAHKGQTCRQ